LNGEVGAAGTALGKREVFAEYLRVAGFSPWPFSRRPETSGGSQVLELVRRRDGPRARPLACSAWPPRNRR